MSDFWNWQGKEYDAVFCVGVIYPGNQIMKKHSFFQSFFNKAYDILNDNGRLYFTITPEFRKELAAWETSQKLFERAGIDDYYIIYKKV